MDRWRARNSSVARNARVRPLRPEVARGVTPGHEPRFGAIVLPAEITDGTLVGAEGPPGPALRPLRAGGRTPAAAIADGSVELTGDPALLTRFVEMFRIG